jgi:predicted methyltransferase
MIGSFRVLILKAQCSASLAANSKERKMKLNVQHVAIFGVAMALAAAAAPFKIDDSSRPAEDVARDAARKPAEMIAFAKIKPGQTVIDLVPGKGYFTRVFAQAVGRNGQVITFWPAAVAEKFPDATKGTDALSKEPAYANVHPFAGDAAGLSPVFAPAGSVDLIWTAQNYHDFHAELPAGTPAGYNKAAYAALKPGGYYVIIDHSAANGSGLRDAEKLHRIDAATVKAEVTAVGFKFDGESKLLTNKADDRTKLVFDPAIRGKTDQFVFRFVKPKK